MASQKDDRAVYSIGAVARMLDVPTSTLRAWEERYSTVTPSRSGGAQRLYSRAQVEQLRFIKAQMDSGASAADAHRLLAQELAASRIPAAPPERQSEAKPLILIVDRDAYAADLAEFEAGAYAKVGAALEAGDFPSFDRAYRAGIDSSDTYHAKWKKPFIRFRLPDRPPDVLDLRGP